jgi:hypothetical protein
MDARLARSIFTMAVAAALALSVVSSPSAEPRPRARAHALVKPDATPADSTSPAGGTVPDAASMLMNEQPTPTPAHDHPTLLRHEVEGKTDCLSCHAGAAESPYPKGHEGRSAASCLHCHIPERPPTDSDAGGSGLELATNGYCFGCHGNRDLVMRLADKTTLGLFVDGDVYGRSVHGRAHAPCVACHRGFGRYPHPDVPARSRRELSRWVAQQGCFSCHETIFSSYRHSVHGRALIEEGNLDVPGCPDCHGIHDIKTPHSAMFRMGSPDTCSRCHADRALTAKYGMSPDVTRTYLRDFHGTTVRLTRAEGPTLESKKPVCYDCHGIHDIKKTDDPDSHVVKEHLVETCRRCHPGATASFPAAWLKHYEPDRKRWPLVYWVNLAYKILIPGIIGPMVLYILLDLMRAVIDRVKRRRPT